MIAGQQSVAVISPSGGLCPCSELSVGRYSRRPEIRAEISTRFSAGAYEAIDD